jgi:hypothetical protein
MIQRAHSKPLEDHKVISLMPLPAGLCVKVPIERYMRVEILLGEVL